MWFEIDASGIKIKFQINGYQPTNKYNWDSEWCRCDFLFSSGDWLNYHKENDEVLLSIEVDELEEKLSKLLDNKLLEIEEMTCIEPDFIFKLYPQIDLRDDFKYTDVQQEYEIQDIHLEWKIFFWHGVVLTDNYITITLNREGIESLRDYLSDVINRNN